MVTSSIDDTRGRAYPKPTRIRAAFRKPISCSADRRHTEEVLARPHLSIGGTRPRLMTKPSPSLLQDVVSPKVLDAMTVASKALVAAGVRHVVVGGLAVGANGYPRNTADVDFLVGAEAFEHHAGGLVTLRAGVPFQVNGIAIDFLSPDATESFLEAELSCAPGAFLDPAPLVYLKLKASRLKDQVDVLELIKASLDIDACRAFLTTHAPSLVVQFEKLVERATTE